MFPEILNFEKTDSLELFIETINEAKYLDKVRLNKDGQDLECRKGEDIKYCTVKKDHFKGKGGYYTIYHKNSEGKYEANYETFGVNVVLSSGKINKISLILFALVYFLAL